MQSIAFELGIAETAFLVPGEDGTTFGLRWFSPATEIDLCGHATLASAHALRQWGTVDGTQPLTFHTKSGPLLATFDDDRVILDFPADPVTAAPLPKCLETEWPGAVVHSGRTAFFTFVVLGSAEAVRVYEPDLAAIASTGDKALLLTAAADPASGPTTCSGSSGPTSASPKTPRQAPPNARPGRTGPASWDAATWWCASCPLGARPSTCAPRVIGSGSAAMRPRS
jgi:predicted PhzF superfamily epimerase YddE/YHI9